MPRESIAAKRERTGAILERLAGAYPESRCSLDHETPFQLLAATILSAQCTDALVNRVTPGLFARYPTPEALAAAPAEEVEETIRSVNFYRNKAKSLQGMARALAERHGGEVPRTMDELVRLPGVGRKTANVVLGVAFGIAEGVVVDTHVKRIANRLGLTKSDDPEQIERDLLKLLPPGSRVVFTHRVIDHGRAVCVAREPRCGGCVLRELCPAAAR
ncbi:MAG TPA: endonuclease III [Longimicrobiaceae bacterium]|nr:endonuclease III [Longimicrobiaceae bacterium]